LSSNRGGIWRERERARERDSEREREREKEREKRERSGRGKRQRASERGRSGTRKATYQQIVEHSRGLLPTSFY
jgi:hypothetical protein